MNCPEFNELMEYLDGELAGERLSRIEEHLENCSICTDLIRSQRKLESAWRDDFRYPSDESFRACEAVIGSRLVRRSRWRVALPVAAAFVAVLLGVKLVLLDGPAPGNTLAPPSPEVGEYVPLSMAEGNEDRDEVPEEQMEVLLEEPPVVSGISQTESSSDEVALSGDSPELDAYRYADGESSLSRFCTVDSVAASAGGELHAGAVSGTAGLEGLVGGGSASPGTAPSDAAHSTVDDPLHGDDLISEGTVDFVGSEELPMAGVEVNGAGGGGSVTTTGYGSVGSTETADRSLADGTAFNLQQDTATLLQEYEVEAVQMDLQCDELEFAMEAGEETEEEAADLGMTDCLSTNRDYGADLQPAYCEIVSTLETSAVPAGSSPMVTLVFDEDGIPDSLTCVLLDSLLTGWSMYIPSAFRDTVLIVPASEVVILITSEAPGIPAQ